MAPTITPTTALPLDSKPVCADPFWLPYVEATYEHPASDEARVLREWACSRCPVRSECLALAMTAGQWGTWGGVPMNNRTRNGAPSAWPRKRHAA